MGTRSNGSFQRKLPLIVGRPVPALLVKDASHVRFQDLVIRGSSINTVRLERARDVEPTQVQEGIGAVLANLIGLLDTFIGEDLALRLVREAWPDAPRPNNTDSETQEARS